MTPYKAMYINSFIVNGEPVPAVERLAFLINGWWIHSTTWPKDINDKWKVHVQDCLNNELAQAKERLSQLREAQKILDDIEAYGR